jgi:iron complex transport system permease protein
VKRVAVVLAVTVLVLAASATASLLVGPVRVSARDAVTALLHPAARSRASEVVLGIRAPRVAAGAVVGAALALAGLCFQVLLKNPLASEYTLGVSSGASLGAVLGALVFGVSTFGTPAAAFSGALLTIAFVYGLSRARLSFQTDATILAGVIFTSLANAALSLVLAIASPHELHTFFFWFLGSLANAEWSAIRPVAAAVAILIAAVFALARPMDALSVDDDFAAQVGVDVPRTKGVLFLLASLLTAVVVSLAGTVGFVGLVVPHLARRAAGVSSRALIPVCVLMGAALCVTADLLARTLLAPNELPVGVVTAFVGAPVFIALLARRRA